MPSVYKQKKTTSKVILFCLIVMCKSENLNTYSAKNIGRMCHCRALMHSAYCCSASKYSFKESPQERHQNFFLEKSETGVSQSTRKTPDSSGLHAVKV